MILNTCKIHLLVSRAFQLYIRQEYMNKPLALLIGNTCFGREHLSFQRHMQTTWCLFHSILCFPFFPCVFMSLYIWVTCVQRSFFYTWMAVTINDYGAIIGMLIINCCVLFIYVCLRYSRFDENCFIFLFHMFPFCLYQSLYNYFTVDSQIITAAYMIPI